MVLYVKLDQHEWGVTDFTDENTYALTGTIYSDRQLSTPVDLTGWNLTFRMISQSKIIFDNDNDITTVTPASGTWRYLPESGRSALEADGQVYIRLEKSGSQITAIGVNGSADLHVMLV